MQRLKISGNLDHKSFYCHVSLHPIKMTSRNYPRRSQGQEISGPPKILTQYFFIRPKSRSLLGNSECARKWINPDRYLLQQWKCHLPNPDSKEDGISVKREISDQVDVCNNDSVFRVGKQYFFREGRYPGKCARIPVSWRIQAEFDVRVDTRFIYLTRRSNLFDFSAPVLLIFYKCGESPQKVMQFPHNPLEFPFYVKR